MSRIRLDIRFPNGTRKILIHEEGDCLSKNIVRMEIPALAKFPAGTVLMHQKGGTYVVILTPDVCTLEASRKPAYAYLCLETTKKIHVREQEEMEDGRFIVIANNAD